MVARNTQLKNIISCFPWLILNKLLHLLGNIFAIEPIISYNSNDYADICEPEAMMYSSTIRPASLETIQKTFRIPYDFVMVETLMDDKAHP